MSFFVTDSTSWTVKQLGNFEFFNLTLNNGFFEISNYFNGILEMLSNFSESKQPDFIPAGCFPQNFQEVFAFLVCLKNHFVTELQNVIKRAQKEQN